MLTNKLIITLNPEVTIAPPHTTSSPAPLPTENDKCYYDINESKKARRPKKPHEHYFFFILALAPSPQINALTWKMKDKNITPAIKFYDILLVLNQMV